MLKVCGVNAAKVGEVDYAAVSEIYSPTGGPIIAYLENLTASCSEADGTKNLEVKLSGAAAQIVTVNWTATGVEAYDHAQNSTYGHGQDFGPASGQLIFNPGIVSRNITLTIYNGTAATPDLRLNVDLVSAVGATIDPSKKRCILTIQDNDRDALVTMTNLPATCPIGGCSGWGGSAWNMYNNGTNATANRTRMQAVMDHFKNSHNGKAVVCLFPVGTYLMDCNNNNPGLTRSVYLPTATNKITLQGMSANPLADGGSHSVLKIAVPYPEWSRMLRNDSAGYIYGHVSANSGANRLLLRHLVFHMDSQNCGSTYENYELEQTNAVFITAVNQSGTTWYNGMLEWTAENCRDMWSPNGGIRSFYNTDLRLYNHRSSNSYKGFMVMSGGHQRLRAYNILSDGELDGGGFWMEAYMKDADGNPTRVDLNVEGDNWIFNNGRRFLVSPGTDFAHPGNPGILNVSNVTFGKHVGPNLTVHRPGWNYSVWGSGSSEGSITINGGSMWGAGQNRIRGCGPITFNNVHFYCYKHSTDPETIIGGGPYNQFAYEPADLKLTFNTCTFSADPTNPPPTPMGWAYNGGAGWNQYPNAYVRFNTCTFENTVAGAVKCREAFRGGPKMIFDGCIFKCSNAGGQYVFDMTAWSDNSGYPGWLVNKDPSYIGLGQNKIYYFYSDAAASQNLCWLEHNGDLTHAQAYNSIGVYSGNTINRICLANALANVRISAIARSTQTLVTTATAHGLVDGDKIVFDGFSSTGNASWFTNLSPHTGAPAFTVDYVSTTQFRIRNWADTAYIDSSGYSADYNSGADIALVSKYPFRTITGAAGYNPVTSKPAGFQGDRYSAGGTLYRCTMNGINGVATWIAE